MMTSTNIPTITLGDLHNDPTTPLPYLVGGDPGDTEALGAEHAQRLLSWAVLSGWRDIATIVVTGYIGSPSGRWSGSRHLTQLQRPEHHAANLHLTGWTLRLSDAGRTHDVDLTFSGEISDHGTAAEQAARWQEHAAGLKRHATKVRAEDGLALSDAVYNTTRERAATQKASEQAEQAWQDAIRAALAGGKGATEVAQMAGISRARVYQIRDGRR